MTRAELSTAIEKVSFGRSTFSRDRIGTARIGPSAATRECPPFEPASPRRNAFASFSAVNTREVISNRRSPSALRQTPRGFRSKRLRPQWASSSRTWDERVDWLIAMPRAA